MADIKKYNGSTWEHSLRKLTTSTDTLTTLPTDIYADGNNATVGISGNTVQNGTPTPDNPIMPQGTGERTGNLFNYETMRGGTTRYYLDESGNEIQNNFWSITKYIPVDGTVFTLTRTFGGTAPAICLYDSNQNFITGVAYQGEQVVTISSNTNAAYIRFSYFIGEPLEDIEHDMLNSGSTAKPFEPYGYKIPISSAGQTTPVYLGEVESTRRIKKLVLTGNETFYKNDTSNPNNYLYYQTGGYRANEYCLCTHLVNMGTLSTSKVGVFNVNNVLYLNFGSAIMGTQPSGNTVAGLKEYLATQYANGTPVCVWYVLATPETAVVNEPLRKIGDYVDTVNGISIPTITGKDTFDVETSLKPSEVELTYTGWHDANVQEWDGSQWG